MASKDQCPTISRQNLSSPTKWAQAVAVANQADSKAKATQSDVAYFLYAVEMFQEDASRKVLKDEYGAHSPSISKAKKVVTHYLGENFGTDHTVTVEDFVTVVEMANSEHGTVFAAYRALFPARKVEKGLADELARLFRKAQKDGLNADDFGLLALGVAQSVEEGTTDEDDDQ
jgi:hypothetical protein